MNTCTRAISADCDDADLRPVLLYMRHTPRLVCGRCCAYMTANGIPFTEVERRGADRPFTPPWLARLTARDMTDAA